MQARAATETPTPRVITIDEVGGALISLDQWNTDTGFSGMSQDRLPSLNSNTLTQYSQLLGPTGFSHSPVCAMYFPYGASPISDADAVSETNQSMYETSVYGGSDFASSVYAAGQKGRVFDTTDEAAAFVDSLTSGTGCPEFSAPESQMELTGSIYAVDPDSSDLVLVQKTEPLPESNADNYVTLKQLSSSGDVLSYDVRFVQQCANAVVGTSFRFSDLESLDFFGSSAVYGALHVQQENLIGLSGDRC
jgi:hypothetical protein